MKLYNLVFFPIGLLFVACADNKHYTGTHAESNNATAQTEIVRTANRTANTIDLKIKTGTTHPDELVSYASSLMGIPYKYGSIDPNQGFDCSGFITHVFNHHGISVPRSSRDFTNVEREINLKKSKAGDLILFTGTDSTIREVGHMGIITENNGRDISFIHSTSGKAYGVTVTPLNKYYQGRFVKAIRVFNN